jgi:hypothetical protein
MAAPDLIQTADSLRASLLPGGSHPPLNAADQDTFTDYEEGLADLTRQHQTAMEAIGDRPRARACL